MAQTLLWSLGFPRGIVHMFYPQETHCMEDEKKTQKYITVS